MSGSQEFLGRQLAQQAEKLAELVEKMSLMIQAQENSIEKFSIASNNKQNILYPADTEIKGTGNLKKIKLYFSGSILLMIGSARNTYTSNTATIVYLNGVQILKYDTAPNETTINRSIEVIVKDGDELQFRADSWTYYKDVYLAYDFINKPDISIVEGN